MKLLTRYLFRHLGVAVCYALIALVALFSFFELPAALADVGQGSYTFLTAAVYTGLKLFGHLYTVLPLAVLIGTLAALSQLAAAGELTVIRTGGTTLGRLSAAVACVGLVFGTAGFAVGEWVSPRTERWAEQLWLNASQQTVSVGRTGLWFKQGNEKISVGEMLPDGQLRHIRIYDYHEEGYLKTVLQAERASILPGHKVWVLEEVAGTEFLGHGTRVFREKYREWPSSVGGALLEVLLVDEEQMSAGGLSAYIHHLRDNGQSSAAYENAFWRKLLYPLICTVMALTAFAFAPRQTRFGSIGTKIFTGIAIGMAFHFGSQLFSYLARLTPLPPAAAAVLPLLICALGAWWWLDRQESGTYR